MESASRTTCFQDSKYHSKRLRDLLLQKSYQKQTASIHVIRKPSEFDLSLEASFDIDNKVDDVSIE